jgi:hypothetical protein
MQNLGGVLPGDHRLQPAGLQVYRSRLHVQGESSIAFRFLTIWVRDCAMNFAFLARRFCETFDEG